MNMTYPELSRRSENYMAVERAKREGVAKVKLSDIELYEQKCPTDLADDEAVKEAINAIIAELKKPKPTIDTVINMRNRLFGARIVEVIEMIVEDHRAEYEADMEFEDDCDKAHMAARNQV